ncbi:hypothetical protein ACWEPL_14200 [Nonomuraea sp. NPDC004186]
MRAVADLAVQSRFSHYFVAGTALCVVHRYGPIIAARLGNAVHRGVEFHRQGRRPPTTPRSRQASW